LAQLKELKNLKQLLLLGDKTTEAGRKRLEAALPSLRISH
jgi:hypothetical protein